LVAGSPSKTWASPAQPNPCGSLAWFYLSYQDREVERLIADFSQTIFSTGLFVLSTIPIFEAKFPVNTTTKFDPALAAAFNGTSGLDPQQISNGPLYSWYGHIAHGLPYPPGSTAEYVFQTFGPAGHSPPNASLSAEVEAFSPSANCSVIDVKLDGPSFVQGFNKPTPSLQTYRCSYQMAMFASIGVLLGFPFRIL
jgi:hypothetical protein